MQVGEYQTLCTLSRGKHGCIYKATSSRTGQHYIIKTHKENVKSLTEIYRLQKEFEIGRHASRAASHVIQYIDIIEVDNNSKTSSDFVAKQIFLIIEDFDAVDLSTLIPQDGFPVLHFLNVAIQIVSGLQEIHDKNVIHGDLKPSNCVSIKTSKSNKYR